MAWSIPMWTLDSTEAMAAFASEFAACLPASLTVFLQGPLGAGKTTFVRGLLRALGHQGPVRSPTYTLVEPYQVGGHQIYHFDLYRLADPGELEYLGVRDYFQGDAIRLLEWPHQGGALLGSPDLSLEITPVTHERRCVELRPGSPAGDGLLARLAVSTPGWMGPAVSDDRGH